MTLSDLQDHTPIAGLFKYDFSYSYAAVDEISIDIMLHCPSAIVDLHVKIVVNTVRYFTMALLTPFFLL